MLPPGDLRMALAALCGDDDWGTTWSKVVQHRFGGDGELAGHAVGNLLIVALWDLLGDAVAGAGLGGPAAAAPRAGCCRCRSVPLDIVAEVRGADPAGRRDRPRPRPGRRARSRPAGVGRYRSCRPTRRPCRRPCTAVAGGGLGGVRARARGSPACYRTCWCPSWPTRLRDDRGAAAGGAEPGTAAGGDRGLLAAAAPGGSGRARAGTARSTSCSRTDAAAGAAVRDGDAVRAGEGGRPARRPRLVLADVAAGATDTAARSVSSLASGVRRQILRMQGEDAAHGDDRRGEGRAQPADRGRSRAAARPRSSTLLRFAGGLHLVAGGS